MRLYDYNGTKLLRTDRLPIVNYDASLNSYPERKVVLSGILHRLLPGDLLHVAGQLQVSNELEYAVECAFRLVLTPDELDNNGHVVAYEGGDNVVPQVFKGEVFPGQHHRCYPITALYRVDYWIWPKETMYLNLVAYAGGSSSTKPDEHLEIDSPTYMRWTVMREDGR